MGIRRLVSVIAFLALLELCCGYQFYQLRIPNGEMVPHPCKANNIWKGVGHLNRLGGGPRNKFGEDFQRNGYVWNETLCNLDSDGDGLTNAQELGDPNCTWRFGDEPLTTTSGLSHPGVCEPIDSVTCLNKSDWVDCTQQEFSCPAFDEPETFNYTVRIPETPVPSDVTTYTCMFFEMPSDQEYHLVAYTPHIDNAAVMHHLVVYGCTGDISQDVQLNTPTTCNMGSGHPSCTDVIQSWTVGLPGGCINPNAGFLIGGSRGYRYATFQLHWNNPEQRSDYNDSSGINFYLTPKLRTYNAGVFVIAQSRLVIPPNEPSVDVEGGCSGKCTRLLMTGPINVTRVTNHMHYLGKSQYTEIRRNGVEVISLANDTVYNYDSPVTHFYDNGVGVLPGDDLHTTCVFKSTSRAVTTYFGEETADEMCFAFFTFYPKENVRETVCTKWASLDLCEARTGTVQGCNLLKMADKSDVHITQQFASINQKCSITHCRKECKEYVKVLKSSDPCYQGDVYKLRKERPNLQGGMNPLSYEDLQFYSKVDSCDVEIQLERIEQDKDDDVTGEATVPLMGVVTCIVTLFMGILL